MAERRSRKERRASSTSERTPNVGARGRWASIAAGGVLGALGLASATRARPRGASLFGVAAIELLRRGATGWCALYDALGIDTTARGRPSRLLPDASVQLARSITIGRPIGELRKMLDAPETLARCVPGFDLARRDGEHRLAVAVNGADFFVDFEREGPDQLRFWLLAPDFELEEGAIELYEAPGDRGTEVAVEATVLVRGGRVGAAIARALRGVPSVGFIGEALYRLRAMLVAGEVPVSDDTSARRRLERRPRAKRSDELQEAKR